MDGHGRSALSLSQHLCRDSHDAPATRYPAVVMSAAIRESAGGHRIRGGLGAGRRAPWFAALLVGICLAPAAFSATRADASLGELSFLGCIGQVTLNECAAVPG